MMRGTHQPRSWLLEVQLSPGCVFSLDATPRTGMTIDGRAGWAAIARHRCAALLPMTPEPLASV